MVAEPFRDAVISWVMYSLGLVLVISCEAKLMLTACDRQGLVVGLVVGMIMMVAPWMPCIYVSDWRED